jgi:hypothetical protein
MWQQADYLSRHLELDLGGNHLVENLAALTTTASLLVSRQSGSWLKMVEPYWRRELKSQILEHGEHFERSPMYHCHVLGHMLAVAVTCRDSASVIANLCAKTARRMVDFLRQLLHPDAEIPLLGDSGFGETLSVHSLRRLADLAGIEWNDPGDGAATVGPYWLCRKEASMLLVDAGPVGASTLPAHAHCDLLGLEASLDGQRWFVDSGNYNYDDDSMRRYCRSSLAHNVATIDNQNQCDVWSKFRMGFRGQPTPLFRGLQGEFEWMNAAHDGYRRAGVALLHRLVAARGKDTWLCADFARPTRAVELSGWLHLATGMRIQQLGPSLFRLQLGTASRLIYFASDEVQLTEGWYCPEFGKRVPSTVFRYSRKLTAAGIVAWVQYPVDAQIVMHEDGRRIQLTLSAGRELTNAIFQWDFDESPGLTSG